MNRQVALVVYAGFAAGGEAGELPALRQLVSRFHVNFYSDADKHRAIRALLMQTGTELEMSENSGAQKTTVSSFLDPGLLTD